MEDAGISLYELTQQLRRNLWSLTKSSINISPGGVLNEKKYFEGAITLYTRSKNGKLSHQLSK